ncbi:MAG: 4Fe-4S dicluster domain-containing protein [Betaproteobacteria bacterium]|nr:MAG: 4Fe-4S dicluster domain-containing protein [Betaproteobacteria bacterium]
MFGFPISTPRPRKDYASCSGCGLCLLVCPVWRRSRDIGLAPLGRAKALQHGAVAADIAESIQSCTLCAACEPACPEDIGLVAMTLDLRRQLIQPAAVPSLRARMDEQAARPLAPRPSSSAVLLPGQALREHPGTLARAAALLGGMSNIPIADDDGSDIALALEAGVETPAQRLQQFLQPLRGLKNVAVADGLLLRHLRQWLPGSKIASLGLALSSLAQVRRALRASDLYVIEPRAYHADYQRLVKHYDALRSDAGCTLNLDLQRIAIPASARSLAQRLEPETAADIRDDSVQARWILQGRNVERIVVENLEDSAAFERVSKLPVVHLADLADDGTS